MKYFWTTVWTLPKEKEERRHMWGLDSEKCAMLFKGMPGTCGNGFQRVADALQRISVNDSEIE
jgi:hypothetical protein